jgi:hypothetical protein
MLPIENQTHHKISAAVAAKPEKLQMTGLFPFFHIRERQYPLVAYKGDDDA